MNRKQQIAFYKTQVEAAKELKLVAMQNHHIATRIESEAKSALELLGAKKERPRKGFELSEEMQLSLKANLIK